MRNVEAFGPERRRPRRVAHDRELAALHRPVERLADDARADAAQLAVVELRLAQDVEPQRRVGHQRVALRLGQLVERRRRCRRCGSGRSSASSGSGPCSSGTSTICWPVASFTILARMRLRNARLASRRRAGAGQARASGLHEPRVDAHRAVELGGRHGEVRPAGLVEVVEPAEVGDPGARQPRRRRRTCRCGRRTRTAARACRRRRRRCGSSCTPRAPSSARAGTRRRRTRSASSARPSASRRPRTPCGRW